ncbi:MAG: helix-turn-helix domain-containing protein, partial [Methylovirgula sp.]
YVEPGYGGLAALRTLLQATSAQEGGVLIGASDSIPLLRGFYEDLFSETWIEPALGDLLEFARRRGQSDAFDPRFALVMDYLNASVEDCGGVVNCARIADLSPSRFQHLFTQHAGVPFRRYRAWGRLRQAWMRIAQGATMTEAAHAAGFFDSAHLAREYRRTFGKAASNGIRRTFRVGSTDWTRDDRRAI